MTDRDEYPQFQYTCMALDNDTNDLWLGTNSELKRHNIANHFWERFDASTTTILLDDEIKEIVIGQKFVCVLTENGVNVFNKDRRTWKLLKAIDVGLHGPIRSMAVHENRVLIGTKGIFSIYDITTESWSHVNLPKEADDKVVAGIIPMNDNKFGLRTQNTLLVFDAERSDYIFKWTFDENINCIYYDDIRQYLWVGLRPGLKCLDLARMDWRNILEPEDVTEITHIFSNDKFIFAIGGAKLFKLKLSESGEFEPQKSTDGLAEASKKPTIVNQAPWKIIPLFEPIEKVPGNFEIIGAALDKEWLWMVSKLHGLIEHEFDFNEINTYVPQITGEDAQEDETDKEFPISFSTSSTRSFYFISENTFWTFEKENVAWEQVSLPSAIYPQPTESVEEPDVLPRNICSISETEIIFMASESVEKKGKGKDKGKVKELPDIDIQDVSSDGNGLSVGTMAGLFRFNYDTNLWKRYSEDEGLLDDEVVKVFSSSNLTIAITKKGLSLLSHSTGSLHSWKFVDIKLNAAPDKALELGIFIFDNVVAIGQDGAFLLYSVPSEGDEKKDWKKISVPTEFKKAHVHTFLRDNEMLWVGGDGFVGAFHIRDKAWQTDIPVAGEVLSILLEQERIWLRLPDSVCWAAREGFEIDEEMNQISLPNTKDIAIADEQVHVLTSDSLFRLDQPEPEEGDTSKTRNDEQNFIITDLETLSKKRERSRPDAENLAIITDEKSIQVITAGASIERFDIKENKWYSSKKWDTFICPLVSPNIKVLKFHRQNFRWSLLALPLHYYPTETKKRGGGDMYIGSSIVLGDTLWYIARGNRDNQFGELKILDLINGNIKNVENLPQIGKLHLDGKDVYAVGYDQLFLYRNASTKYTCYSLGYIFDNLKRTVTDIIETKAQDGIPERPKMPVRIATSILDAKDLWLSCSQVKNPADSSRKHTLVGGGLISFNKKSQKWKWMLNPAEGIIKDDITSIDNNGNNLLLGTRSKLHFFDTSDEKIVDTLTQDDGVLPSKVRVSMNIGEDIWIATPIGYTIFNENDSSMIKYREPIKGQFVRQRFDRDTKAWVEDEEPVEFEPPYIDIHTIIDLENCVLFGTSQGFHEYIKDRDVWFRSALSDGISNPRVRSISRWNNHIILGTDNGIFIIPHGVV